jgi:hypothetical protein
MNPKWLRFLATLSLLLMFAGTTFAVENSRIRFSLGLSGTVAEYNRTDNGTKTDFTSSLTNTVSASGLDLYYVFDNGLGIGLGTGSVTYSNEAVLESNLDETAIGGSTLDLSYTLGEDINLTLGVGIVGSATLTSLKEDGVEYSGLYDTTTKRSNSYFVNIGFALGENWELLLGQRTWDIALKATNTSDTTDVKEYDAKFSVGYLGFGYRFKPPSGGGQ